MGHRHRIVTGLLALLTSQIGCVYFSRIEVRPSSPTAPELTAQEVGRAVAVLGSIVAEFGMIPDPRLGKWEESRGAKRRTVGQWVFPANPPTWKWRKIAVYARVDNETDRFSVLIREDDSMGSTDLTLRMESALTQALAQEFPLSEIGVERETLVRP